MKKVLIAALSLVALASCGSGDKQMYFDNDMSRIYNDATAEFDTLSYAVGMNVGLSLSLQNSHLEFDQDVLLATIDEVLTQKELDMEMLEHNTELMSRYSNDVARPYLMAKRSQAMIQTDRRDTLKLPEVYNEEFTRENVVVMFGRDIAGYITKLALPVNTYWVYKALEDAAKVDSPKVIDSIMSITGNDVRTYMSNYVKNDWAAYNLERTRTWLKNIAQQEGVHPMVVENDTLYYRVDVAGHGLRPMHITDTVAFSYEVFTRSGRSVESTTKRVEALRKNLEQARTNMFFPDSAKREAHLKQLEEQIVKVENLRIPLSSSIIKGSQYALKHVSEGGEITIWMPASLAYGERGNRAVGPNDGVVMRVKLHGVTHVDPEAEATPEDNAVESAKPIKAGKSKVTVMPAKRPAGAVKPAGKQPMIIPVQPAPAPEKK